MPVDADAVSRILAEVAAADILPRFQKLATHEVREKRAGELVTVADVEAERQVSRRLRELLPGSFVVGEEATAYDPELLHRVAAEPDVWLIDPIDGTGNFARGHPVFVVMVGLLRHGESVAGWIHDPIAGRTATAERGAGAWLDGRRLEVAPPVPPAQMRGTLHAGTFARPQMVRQLQARRSRVQALKSLRCAGQEYIRLAEGEMHFSLFTKLMPWDHVPGTVIHREAGGIARTFDGAPYAAQSYGAAGLLLAPDEASWQALHNVLLGEEARG